MLIVFPAGEVSYFDVSQCAITDPVWSPSVARIVQLTSSSVGPVFIHGINSPVFHIAGMIHPRLRDAMLPHELLNKQDSTIRVLPGTPITSAHLAELVMTWGSANTSDIALTCSRIGSRAVFPGRGFRFCAARNN